MGDWSMCEWLTVWCSRRERGAAGEQRHHKWSLYVVVPPLLQKFVTVLKEETASASSRALHFYSEEFLVRSQWNAVILKRGGLLNKEKWGILALKSERLFWSKWNSHHSMTYERRWFCEIFRSVGLTMEEQQPGLWFQPPLPSSLSFQNKLIFSVPIASFWLILSCHVLFFLIFGLHPLEILTSKMIEAAVAKIEAKRG